LLKLKIVIFLIAILLASTIPFTAAQFSISYSITIESPVQGATYNSDSVNVKLKTEPYSNNLIYTVFDIDCYLDNQFYSKVPLNEWTYDISKMCSSGEIVLHISQGEHKIEIKGKGSVNNYWHEGEAILSPVSVSFFVNLGDVPNVFVSCLNEYPTNQAALNITTNAVDADVFYSLDGLGNVSLPQNQAVKVTQNFGGNLPTSVSYRYSITLSGLADGQHVLKAYAIDMFANTGVTESNFAVNTGTSTQQTSEQSSKPTAPLPITIIVGAAIAAAIMGAALVMVLHFKHKPEKPENNPKPAATLA
jgi:hypothetical protein